METETTEKRSGADKHTDVGVQVSSSEYLYNVLTSTSRQCNASYACLYVTLKLKKSTQI
jgi:hypothetical protein